MDACNIVVGYDFFSPVLRTRVVTAFFNIAVGPVPAKVFDFSSHIVDFNASTTLRNMTN